MFKAWEIRIALGFLKGTLEVKNNTNNGNTANIYPMYFSYSSMHISNSFN